tara:strand:+ start:1740 stop:2294 length:555 start_codon:yes stop_codon:yes gene_type:complete
LLETVAVFPPDEVLPYVGKKGTPKKDYTINGVLYRLRMTSLRLQTFKGSTKCVVCGLVGTTFLLEKFGAAESPHFNLYGEGTPSEIFQSHVMTEEKSNLVLLTKDHKTPRSQGGPNALFNMQTMCVICNGLKKSVNLPIRLVRELRRVHDENLTLPKDELVSLINHKRNQLKKRIKKDRRRKKG